MELQKAGESLPFKWKDITFHIRSKALAGDKHELVTLGELDGKGRSVIPQSKLYRKIIERFVISWEGVTEDGKAVPFSVENLERLPMDPKEDVFLVLGGHIMGVCFPKDDEHKKKDS